MRTFCSALTAGGPRRWLGLIAVVGLSLVSLVALAKVTGGGNLSTSQTSAGDFTSGAYAAQGNEASSSFGSIWDNLTYIQCTPTPADCTSPTYARTPCGKSIVSQAWRGDPTVCDPVCAQQSIHLALCQDEGWLNSVCGQKEQVRMLAQDACGWHSSCPLDVGGDPADPNNPDCVWVCDGAQSECGHAMHVQYDEEQPTYPDFPYIDQGRVVIPSDPAVDEETHLDNDGYSGAVVRRDIEVSDESDDDMSADGTGVHYWSVGVNEGLKQRNPTTRSSIQDEISLMRSMWEASGNAVQSCREYIYEKYYDYSRFEDESRSNGDSPRARFNAAYGNMGDPWAIGTHAINGDELQRRDGVENDDQVKFPHTDQMKNPMFDTHVHNNTTDRQELIDHWEFFQHKWRVAMGDRVLEVTVPRPMSHRQVLIMDDEIDALLREGRANHRFRETWAWHRDKEAAIAAAGYLDEELLALDKIKDRLTLLLHQRRAMELEFHKAMKELMNVGEVPIEIPAFESFDPNIYSNPADGFSNFFESVELANQARNAEIGIETAFSTGQSTDLGAAMAYGVPGSGSTQTYSNPNPGGYGGLGGYFSRMSATGSSVGSSITEEVHLEFVDGDPLRRVFDAGLALIAQDDVIEAVLVHARSRGCLDLTPGNPCDWSPAYFAQRVEDPFMRAREREYDRCLEYTASVGNFSEILSTPADRFYVDVGQPACGYSVIREGFAGEHICDDSAYNTSIDQVENYFACVDKFKEDIVTCLNEVMKGGGVILNPDGTVSLKEHAGDGDSFGGGPFKLSYDYDVGYGVEDLPPPSTSPDGCALKPFLRGAFNATAKVLVADIALVNASGDIDLDDSEPHPHAQLEVLGQQLIGIQASGGASAHGFNVIAEETVEKSGEIFSLGASFVIVVVPVSIKGGIAGRIGANFQLAAGSGGSSGPGCQDGGMVLRATAEPFAGIDAFAKASIDAVIVEAGIKITVTIIEVSFPFTTGLQFTGKPTAQGVDLYLNADTSLDVVFKFLGGRFSVFIEVCFIFCEEWEETLFDWDPLTFKTSLFATQFKVPLGPILELNSQQ